MDGLTASMERTLRHLEHLGFVQKPWNTNSAKALQRRGFLYRVDEWWFISLSGRALVRRYPYWRRTTDYTALCWLPSQDRPSTLTRRSARPFRERENQTSTVCRGSHVAVSLCITATIDSWDSGFGDSFK